MKPPRSSLAEALQQLDAAAELRDAFPAPWLDETFAAEEPSLDADAIAAQSAWCNLPADALRDAVAAAARIAELPAAVTLLRALFRRIFLADGEYALVPGTLEHLPQGTADAATLLLALGALPRIRAMHVVRGVPADISRDTCGQVAAVCANYRGDTGRNGMYLRQLKWFRYYLDPELLYLRVGRFEYMAKPFSRGLRVLRPRRGGDPVILAADGTPFDAEGFALGPADADRAAFTATAAVGDDAFTGHPVDGTTGRTSPQLQRFPFAEYLPALLPDDPALDMHIPFGGGMRPEAAEESWRRAFELYARLLPEARHPRAISCSSWVFNPGLPQILPADSNLVRLQRRVRLAPIATSPVAGLWFIFRQEADFDLATAPRRTSLQRAVADSIASGQRWRGGAMILLPEDIPNPPTQGNSRS